MKQIVRKSRGVLFIIFSFICISIQAQLPVFPTPTKESTQKGSFILNKATELVLTNQLSNEITTKIKSDLTTISQKTKDDNSIKVLPFDFTIPAEGYRLQVTPTEIEIVASSESGVIYAIEVIKQLARVGQGEIRCCTIDNSPRFSWRGFMLDESRHFFGKEKVKSYLDIMASLHLNVFHWHLTDEEGWRIEIKKYPKLTTVGAMGNWHDPKAEPKFYTQADIKEIVAYATERNILIVPEFDMPGHATAAAKSYPEISGGGEGRWEHFTFHPTKKESFTFISDVLDELFELFPSPYIHIGGDEVHYGNQSWYTDPEIQSFIKEHKLGDAKGLEHYFIRRIADMVADKGRKIIGWDEILDAGVPPSKAVVMWWRHDRKHQLVKALEQGYQVILTPRRPLYADFYQHSTHKVGRFWNGFNPIEDILSFPESIEGYLSEYTNQVLGMQMNLWTERIADVKRLDFMTFPRLIGVAESAWTVKNNKKYSLFMLKLRHFLNYLDTLNIYYFDPLNPSKRVEPIGPEKEDVIQNG